jgi:hypothetical protein
MKTVDATPVPSDDDLEQQEAVRQRRAAFTYGSWARRIVVVAPAPRTRAKRDARSRE